MSDWKSRATPITVSDWKSRAIPVSNQNIAQNAGRQALNLAVNPIKPLLSKEGMQFGKNVATDIGNQMQGIAKAGHQASFLMNPVTAPFQGRQAIEDIQGQAINEAKKPIPLVGQLVEDIKHPLTAIRERPVSTAINVLPIAKGAGAMVQGAGKIVQKMAGYINPDAIRAITKSLRPGKWDLDFQKNAELALPEIKKAGIPINTVEDFVDASKIAKKNTWGKIQNILDKASGKAGYTAPNYQDVKNRAMQIKSEVIGNYNESMDFVNQVKNISGGGIRPYRKSSITGKRPEIDEYINDIPNNMKNAKGMPLDEVVQNYNDTFNTNFTENSFVKRLQLYKNLKRPSSNLNDYINEAVREMQDYTNDSLINGDIIAENIYKTIKPESVKLTPEIGNAIANISQKYKKMPVSIMEAENRLQNLNSELQNFFKNKYMPGSSVETNSSLVANLAERQVLKTELYNKIQSLTGENIAPLKKLYGSLMNVEDTAVGRINVANRNNPISLQEALNGVGGLVELFGGNPLGLLRIGASQGVKWLNNPNFLIRKAISNTGKKPMFSQTGNMSGEFSKRIPKSTIPIAVASNLNQNQAGNIRQTLGYQIGQTVTAPDGRQGKVVGYDKDNHPLIEPLAGYMQK